MARNALRQSQLIEYDHAAAGHAGVLRDRSGELFVKPCKQSEIDFYQSVASHPEFAAFVPSFVGELHLGSNNQIAQAAGALALEGDARLEVPANSNAPNVPVLETTWQPSNGGRIQTDLGIVLENVTADFQRPNILDVKLGARLWADDAPNAKRARLEKAAEESTSRPLGFRIAGMKIFRGNSDTNAVDDGYKTYDKHYGRDLNVDTVHQGFEVFFRLERGTKAKGSIRRVMKRLIKDLKGLAKAIEREESRMYSASLLFIYEGDSQTLNDAFVKEDRVLGIIQPQAQAIAAGIAEGKSHDCGSFSSNGNGVQTLYADDDDVAEQQDSEIDEDENELKLPAIQILKLIDFAHAQWTPGQGSDENLLHGIRNVINLLAGLLG